MQFSLLKGHWEQLSDARSDQLEYKETKKFIISSGVRRKNEICSGFFTQHVKGTSYWIQKRSKEANKSAETFAKSRNYGADVLTSGDIIRWNWAKESFSCFNSNSRSFKCFFLAPSDWTWIWMSRLSRFLWNFSWSPHRKISIMKFLSRHIQCIFTAHFSRSIKCIDLFLLFPSLQPIKCISIEYRKRECDLKKKKKSG